jgi:hypothetical protein
MKNAVFFRNSLLSRMFRTVSEEVTGDWTRKSNENVDNMYSFAKRHFGNQITKDEMVRPYRRRERDTKCLKNFSNKA